jgi:hypothetical protein
MGHKAYDMAGGNSFQTTSIYSMEYPPLTARSIDSSKDTVNLSSFSCPSPDFRVSFVAQTPTCTIPGHARLVESPSNLPQRPPLPFPYHTNPRIEPIALNLARSHHHQPRLKDKGSKYLLIHAPGAHWEFLLLYQWALYLSLSLSSVMEKLQSAG